MTSGPGSSGSRRRHRARRITFLDLDRAVAVSDQAFLHYPPRFIPDLVVADIKTIRERLFGQVDHESYVLDRFHRIADNWSDGERRRP